MTTATASPASLDTAAPTLSRGLWIFARHLTALTFPVLTLAFLWTGPHSWYVAALFLAPTIAIYALDTRPQYERRQPSEHLPAWPFDALVYLLAILQFVVVFELCRMYQHQVIFSFDTVMVFLLVGGTSGFSIITAHELIHRKPVWEQTLGRLILCTVLYEHFYTEHLRGHHVRVATGADPATAKFGEAYEPFFRRTVPAQFRSAWRLEARRLGDEQMSLFDPRMLRNRILHGFVVGWAMAFAAWAAFGFAGFFVFLLQAFTAVRLLEAVNYFEHWGLERRKPRVRPVDSWDTHAWFTYYGLVGLSRHADHHAWPSRPYQQLRVWDEAPLLPAGYVGTIDMVMGRNAEFRHRATLELARRELGPFDATAEVSPEQRAVAARKLAEARAFDAALESGMTVPKALRAAAAEATPESATPKTGWRGRLASAWSAIPVPARVGLVLLGIAVAVSLGGWVEAGAAVALAGLVASNLWILAIIVGGFAVRGRIAEAGHEAISWTFFFALILVLGGLTEAVLA